MRTVGGTRGQGAVKNAPVKMSSLLGGLLGGGLGGGLGALLGRHVLGELAGERNEVLAHVGDQNLGHLRTR